MLWGFTGTVDFAEYPNACPLGWAEVAFLCFWHCTVVDKQKQQFHLWARKLTSDSD
jgi:hypothetical protein